MRGKSNLLNILNFCSIDIMLWKHNSLLS
jgi:hypothetical protein